MKKKILYIYIIILFLFLIFYIGIFLAPYLYDKNIFLSLLIYGIYSQICHQMPERSYYIFNHKMAVCARCFGIYTGILFGMLIYPIVWGLNNFKTPNRWYLILALIPMGIDGTTQLIGLRESFNELRFITGFLGGFVALFYILPMFISVAYSSLKDKTKILKS
ncbi:MAG TPA: DUF2085 domain-containing protein [Methanothermococcus okinawensis]|uniref:DUF2085 domain-containing protein n=1 Tax=Methanothermococcus okinawensis TaxID=155863 RepID=A0A833DQH0_9EURY|nr:DUF2085 domain-containing protein [Methanothermococcus okinawensis]